MHEAVGFDGRERAGLAGQRWESLLRLRLRLRLVLVCLSCAGQAGGRRAAETVVPIERRTVVRRDIGWKGRRRLMPGGRLGGRGDGHRQTQIWWAC